MALGLFVGNDKADSQTELNEKGRQLEAEYTRQLEQLRAELVEIIPQQGSEKDTINRFLASGSYDESLAKYVVLYDAKPTELAAFAQKGKRHADLVAQLLSDHKLMAQMLVADGANAKKDRHGYGPAQYGPSMMILDGIKQVRSGSDKPVLDRLALAISLEHATPIAQVNPVGESNAPKTVDPVKRYLHYEKAYLDGELDPEFDQLTTWELRMVVNGDEPDEALAWGREMLRNFRPDHIYNSNFGWRYVSLVGSDVKYGSENVKHDRPELHKYQNILMNGGVCGRRAFIGRFILRAFGVPTIARPSRGHGALAHWTPDGWVVNLGGGWGCGWTKTRYNKDVDFLANTQARDHQNEFKKVKRAQWAGDVLEEKRIFGEQEESPGFWYGIALLTQREIIDASNTQTLAALGEDLAEANEPTIAERVIASPVSDSDKKVDYRSDGTITIPAAAYSKPKGNTREVTAMKSFDGGMQVYLTRFFPQGKTIMRGGTWKGDAEACTSGRRMLSGGYGRYENWGLRAAMSPIDSDTPSNIVLELGNGIAMEMKYIKPGSFVMGGERETDGRFECVEIPKHEVELTRGFYLGKYEVTQAQYQAIMGTNPSRSTKDPNCPVDNVSEGDAITFCGKLAELSGHDVRLPTEAEWEYASRAGKNTKWFFGNDATLLGEYAWFKDNANAKSHIVGQKKPNPWGLYDIYGNVCERISDKYARNYYSISPKVDPTGPSQGTKSRVQYHVDVPSSGMYELSAMVVTANYDQTLNVSANESSNKTTMALPFTIGQWQDSEPVAIRLTKGKNTLHFWRDQPPQYGITIKQFTLSPKPQ